MKNRLLQTLSFACVVSLSTLAVAQAPHTEWREYGGGRDGAQYSALKQVDRGNVSTLRQVWSYSTGDTRGYLFNPIVVDGTMYVLAKNNSIVALDAATGHERWAHPIAAKTTLLPTRGISYWESADRQDRRLIFAADNALQELNATTGEPITNFGTNGRVDLREGLGRDSSKLTLVQSYNPGRIYKDLVILGSATNEEYSSGPGDVRAYNVVTGKPAWIFHTVPHPGEAGYDTWPKDAWKTVGGANAWSGMALDEARGILYVPTASPKYNFYGANRPGKNLFGDSLLALNAATGKLIWYFQTVHHDIWDYDNASTPMLLTVRHEGKLVDAVAETSKTGYVWVFDRVTGKPLWPVEERPVPKSNMPGEETWPTQPVPTKPEPFGRQHFTVADLNPYMEPAEKEAFRKQMLAADNRGMFTPPGLGDVVEMPGNNGGANFGGSAVDPAHGFLYVVSKDVPAMLKLTLPSAVVQGSNAESTGASVFAANCALCHGADRAGAPPAIPSLVDVTGRLSDAEIRSTVQHGRGKMPAFPSISDPQIDALLKYLQHPENAKPTATAAAAPRDADPATLQYKSSFGFMFAGSGLPAIAPPWTTLTAYDLNTGTIRWKEPLGDVPELAAQGITGTGSHYPKTNPVVTAGGVIFTGTRDRKVRALDSATGKVLWESEVGAALEGMPAVYQVAGREYVVFCAAARATTHTHAVAGRPASQEPIDGAYVAFALPVK